MPVRIYDIARKLGIESKEVITHAKAMGIPGARVPSSTLDKITAEYFEERLRVLYPSAVPQPAVPAETSSAPGADAHSAEHPAPAAGAEPQHHQQHPGGTAEHHAEPEPTPVAPATAAAPAAHVVAWAPSGTPAPATAPTQASAPAPAPAVETHAPAHAHAHAPEAVIAPSATAAPAHQPAVQRAEVAHPVAKDAAPAPAHAPTPAEPAHEPAVAHAPAQAAPPEAPAAVATATPEPVAAAVAPAPAVEAARAAEPAQPAPIQPPVAPVHVAPQPPISAEPKPAQVQPAAIMPQPVSTPAPAPAPAPAASATASAPAPTAAAAAAAASAAPAAPVAPPAPVVPPAPKIGDKVGFIQLPNRPRPAERDRDRDRGPQKPLPPGQRPPVRPEMQPRQQQGGRDQQRPGNFGNRPMQQGQRQPFVPERRAEPAKPAGPATPKYNLPDGAPVITIKPPIVVRDLAEQVKRKPYQLIADLMELGVFATVNQSVEPDIAKQLCAKHGFRFEVERREKGAGVVHAPQRKKPEIDAEEKVEDLKPRAPVVTIMGHVDHGKTTLLDVIRRTDVAAGEAGGITQHIGAYTISIPHPERPKELQQITFLDTPGHAAFSSMRARGANVTDLVVLVVAANDGVMPQTMEAISHAQAAKVPILVAVNKCDHPNANPLRVRQQLQERGLISDEWGGDTIFVDVSALTKRGIDKLLEMIVLQADLLELKANPTRKARGNVIESGLEPGGPTATVLVRKGTLKVGDTLLCGEFYGRVRAMINSEDKRLKEAGPSVAVKVLGLNGVPEAGVEFTVEESEKIAREILDERASNAPPREKEQRPRVTLETLFDTLESGQAKILKVVIKGDTQGSVEAIVEALHKIDSEKVSLEVMHSAVGTVSEGDVILASAAKAIVLGFHTRIDSGAAELAKREGVQIKLYAIIYELIDQVKEAMAGLLDPLLREAVFGAAEVRKVFPLSKGGNVAGCVVASGRLVKGKARIMRRKNLVFEGIIHTLRRFQDEVNEVRAGMECGIRLDGFDDFQVGDQIECYTIEKVAQKL